MHAPTLQASRKTKKTAIGELPVDWGVTTLQDGVATIIDYRGRAPEKASLGVPLITARNVRSGWLDFSEVEFMKEESFAEWVSRGTPLPGDILLTTEAPLGNVAEFPTGRFAIAQRVVALRGKPGVLLNRFLKQFLLSEYGQRAIQFRGTGSTATGIRQSELRKVNIPVPSVREQERIANLLETWDRAIERQEQLLATKQELKQGLMQQLIAGKKRFTEFKGQRWQKVRLRDALEQVSRRNTVGCHTILTGSAKHGLINQREFYDRRVASEDTSNYYLVKHGEFAYNRSSANGYPFGATKRLDSYDMGVLSTLYLVFRIADEQRLNSDYAAHLFESPYFSHQLSRLCREGARSHGLLNITATEFFSMHVMLPSVAEQRRIVSALNDSDRELVLLERESATLREQKKGLMQKLLTGKVRVKAT